MEKSKTWEKSITENSITRKTLVEEIENGYLITVSKCGYVKSKDGDIYKHEEKKYYSKVNPLSTSLDSSQMALDVARALEVNTIFED
jgi:hypothetical protein